MCDNYPPGAKYDPSAPYNQTEAKDLYEEEADDRAYHECERYEAERERYLLGE